MGTDWKFSFSSIIRCYVTLSLIDLIRTVRTPLVGSACTARVSSSSAHDGTSIVIFTVPPQCLCAEIGFLGKFFPRRRFCTLPCMSNRPGRLILSLSCSVWTHRFTLCDVMYSVFNYVNSCSWGLVSIRLLVFYCDCYVYFPLYFRRLLFDFACHCVIGRPPPCSRGFVKYESSSCLW